MKSKFFLERGQALILITLAAVGLFGIAGLAIDGSAKFSDRRHAQNAADTAALAAILEMARQESHGNGVGVKCPPQSGTPTVACVDVIDAAKDRADGNGYDDNKQSNIVEVNIPPKSGIYSDCTDVHFDCNDYVQVIITSHVDTWFARVVGIAQTHNRVEAVASKISYYEGALFGGSAVVALSPNGCALTAGGTAKTTVIGGGIYSNSDSASCSFKQNGCSGEIDVFQEDGTTLGTITSVGNMQVNSNCDEQIQADLAPQGEKQQPFPPLFHVAEPAACSTNGTKSTTGGVTTLTPGYFQNIPPSGSGSTVILTPGVYCVGRQLKTTGSEIIQLQGTFSTTPGVFIYIKPGGSQNPISLQGGDVQLWGINSASVAADPTLDPYKGYLIYVAPDYATGSPTNCTINGSSGQMLKGTIYAPFCNMKINGTSDGGFQSQIIGYTVDMSGTAAVTINYNSDDNASGTIPLQVGLSK